MKEVMEKAYQSLVEKYDFKVESISKNINFIIKQTLTSFLKECRNTSIWCYGEHTRMLMADFISELRNVNIIIDNKYKQCKEGGFKIIRDEQIEDEKIDGIIISTYKYKEEIIEEINRNHPGIKYLDIYKKLAENGIYLQEGYYSLTHPYHRYKVINELQRKLSCSTSDCGSVGELRKLINEYAAIRDFKTAIHYAEKLYSRSGSSLDRELLLDLSNIYRLEMESAASISENNVLMLCIDGLRRKDLQSQLMPQMYSFIEEKTFYYKNAYSVSTSTYESLVPAYSENNDLRTRYYEVTVIPEEDCRFICEAEKQERKIYFYTDSGRYVEGDQIIRNENFQTATEKLWNFIVDSVDEKNGLFYVHILYESHFSYANPYTTGKLIADGSNIMFDYLEKNGGRIRTDYRSQHEDALRYIDDTVVPLLEKMKCRMVVYADHGNIILDENTTLKEVGETNYTFHEDLIRIPLAVKSPELEAGEESSLISLMSINDIVISLIKKQRYISGKRQFIKAQRSAIYNPDFRFIYKENGQEQGLQAFEVFVFDNGYKLAIYENGLTELYSAADDEKVKNKEQKIQMFDKIKEFVTVCEIENIEIS